MVEEPSDEQPLTYWDTFWIQFKKNKIVVISLYVFLFFFLFGLYAPFLASSKPLLIYWDHTYYSPLLRYLFFRGYYTKGIDLFFNLLMFTLPLGIGIFCLIKSRFRAFFTLAFLCLNALIFGFLYAGFVKNPAIDIELKEKRASALNDNLTWRFELQHMAPYEMINMLLTHIQFKKQHDHLVTYAQKFEKAYHRPIPTLWSVAEKNNKQNRDQLTHSLQQLKNVSLEALPSKTIVNSSQIEGELAFYAEREEWLTKETQKLKVIIPPLIRYFHWEQDAGGSQTFNQFLPWWEVTRINRKDMVAGLLFGIRVSMLVGITVVSLSLFFGLLFGSLAGYFAGKVDLLICRMIEIWEAMPTFFMLLLIIAITQNKSIFLVMAVLGIFGWTGIARFMRAEVLKQRNLPYVMACKSLGFKDTHIMLSQILPNAIPPILTLLPFSMMAAITSEAGISFLGLGEEGSTSWGVLMDEGRSVFPSESYLLWPPAILLTILLVAIALIGDTLRDCIDPRSHR